MRADVFANHVAFHDKMGNPTDLPALHNYIKTVAMHEAAHAVVHTDTGVGIKHASMRPDENLDGHVLTCQNFAVNDPRHAYGALAGPVATSICYGRPLIDPVDAAEALKDHGGHINALDRCWRETVSLVTTPRIWRAVRAVASDLLLKADVSGEEVARILRDNVGPPCPTWWLEQQRKRLLRSGDGAIREAGVAAKHILARERVLIHNPDGTRTLQSFAQVGAA